MHNSVAQCAACGQAQWSGVPCQTQSASPFSPLFTVENNWHLRNACWVCSALHVCSLRVSCKVGKNILEGWTGEVPIQRLGSQLLCHTHFDQIMAPCYLLKTQKVRGRPLSTPVIQALDRHAAPQDHLRVGGEIPTWIFEISQATIWSILTWE